VDSRQDRDAAGDIPQVTGCPAIEPGAVEDQFADDVSFDVVKRLAELAAGRPVGGLIGLIGEQLFEQFVADRVGAVVPGLFRGILLGLLDPCSGFPLDHLDQRVRFGAGILDFLDSDLLDQFLLQPTEHGDLFLGEQDRFEHLVLGQLVGEALDHQHRMLAAADDQVKPAFFELRVGREHDQFVVDHPDADAGERSLEGDRGGQRQRRAGTGDRVHVGVVLGIDREHVDMHLDLVVVPLGEHRTDRPVGESRGENLPQRRAALTFHEATGELARRSEPFPVVNG